MKEVGAFSCFEARQFKEARYPLSFFREVEQISLFAVMLHVSRMNPEVLQQIMPGLLDGVRRLLEVTEGRILIEDVQEGLRGPLEEIVGKKRMFNTLSDKPKKEIGIFNGWVRKAREKC